MGDVLEIVKDEDLKRLLLGYIDEYVGYYNKGYFRLAEGVEICLVHTLLSLCGYSFERVGDRFVYVKKVED